MGGVPTNPPSPLCARGTPILNRDKPADSAVHTGSSTRNAGQAARENGALLNNEVGGWGVTPPFSPPGDPPSSHSSPQFSAITPEVPCGLPGMRLADAGAGPANKAKWTAGDLFGDAIRPEIGD